MTPKQKRFVEEYALDHNAAAAARRAGYSANGAKVTASRLLTSANPVLISAIQKCEAENARDLGLRREDILQGLMDAVEQAKLMADPMSQVAALRQLALLCGFYRPMAVHEEVSARGREYLQRMESLSEAALVAIICAEPVLG